MDPDQTKGSVDDRLDKYFQPAQPAEEVKQPVATPTTEQKPTEAQKEEPKVEAKAEPEAPQLDEEQEALANSKNPERTKAYIEKLKTQLKEATTPKTVEETVTDESVFDIFHPEKQVVKEQGVQEVQPVQQPQTFPYVQAPYLNPLQVQNIQQQYVKPDGTVDIDGFNQAIRNANYGAYQATLKAQDIEKKLARFEQKQEELQAYAQHPEIDPQNKEKFDKRLFEHVRDRLFRNMYEGKKEALLSVTTAVKQEMNFQPKVDVQTVEKQAVEEYKEVQKARNQGPFEAGRGESRLGEATLEDLRVASRKKGPTGDAAIGARLKRLGI